MDKLPLETKPKLRLALAISSTGPYSEKEERKGQRGDRGTKKDEKGEERGGKGREE